MIRRRQISVTFNDRRSETGAGSLMMVGVILGLVTVLWALLTATSFLTAQHRVRAAADMTALTGAQAALDFGANETVTSQACEAARSVAASHQATLDDCQVIAFAGFVAVETRVSVAAPFSLPGLPERLEATAWAGNP
ncbi:MAG: flp pilus-assembly TadE/G-like family protein [Propionibacteriaceae bacterium]|jgi:secretion/DNA translocation related TadE-like protein|nr:flp pilus-assembly TadE/G-like family protein [Propionibacteriaceae bacterium]